MPIGRCLVTAVAVRPQLSRDMTRGSDWSERSRTRWLTPRTPGRRTFGSVISQIAAELGKPRTPLQRYIDDVANEVDDDGRFVYRSIVILGPRRLGKTSIMEPVLTHRGEQKRCELAMTAATGEMAVELFGEVTDGLIDSPVADRFDRAKSQGYSRLTFTRSGSVLRAVTPNARIGHSKSLRLAWVDEFWSHSAAQLKEMRAGYRPTFLTTGGQEWLTSTAGDVRSDAFIAARRQGRADVLAGRNTGRAFFDVSAPEETSAGVSLADLSEGELLEFLADNHPSVGYLFSRQELMDLMLLDLEDLGGRSGLLRAYGNLTDTGETSAVFAPAVVEKSHRGGSPTGDVALGIAVDDLGRESTICVAWRDAAGVAWTMYQHAAGSVWLTGEVQRLRSDYGVSVVAVQGASPARDVADELEMSGVNVSRLSQADTAAAGSRFFREFGAGRVMWDEFDRSAGTFQREIIAAELRGKGSGIEWLPRGGAPLTMLPAGTVALWAHDHMPEPEPVIEPRVW